MGAAGLGARRSSCAADDRRHRDRPGRRPAGGADRSPARDAAALGDGPRRRLGAASTTAGRIAAVSARSSRRAPGAVSQSFARRARRDAVWWPRPGGRVVDGDPPASALIVEIQRAAPRPRDGARAPAAAGRAAARLPRGPRLGALLRGARRRVHPGDRRARAASARTSSPSTAHKLQRGLERGLDGVTTRTLMGNAYPSPGLQGKFYDVDMDPLVEVVRDTVGRHDTFALACTRKYYEDMGYPGHISCTENFNGAGHALRDRRAQGLGGAQLLLQHGLRPRQPAVHRRALVAPRRLRAAAGDDRPGLRVVGLPGRHRPRQRLGDHRRPRARLLAREPLLDRDRPPRDPGGRARADQGDGLPPAHAASSPRASSSTAATGCRTASTTRAASPSTGPAARRPW